MTNIQILCQGTSAEQRQHMGRVANELVANLSGPWGTELALDETSNEYGLNLHGYRHPQFDPKPVPPDEYPGNKEDQPIAYVEDNEPNGFGFQHVWHWESADGDHYYYYEEV